VSDEPVVLGFQSRGTLALPADIRRRYNLDRPGAQVRLIERADGVFELHPLTAVPAEQAWFWAERWQKMEREADADIEAGRVTQHETVEELFDALGG
jgi:bifunctional DNA-binding transcriptional regulator/antitoxin component of YhaV-PrlF toxin-antitoxin module